MDRSRRAVLQTMVAAIFRRAEHLFAVLALLVFAGSLNLLLGGYLGIVGEGGVAGNTRQLLLPAIFLISGCILLIRPANALQAALRNTPTLMLTALAVISCLWSEAPMLTLKRGAMLIGSTVFALYLVTRFDRREVLRLLGWTLGVAAVASLLVVLFLPGRGIATGVHEGAWTGIYHEKNGFGRYMALGVLVFIAMAANRSHSAWLGAGLCGLLVVFSRSTTALVAVVCALGMVALVPVLRQRGLLFISFSILALLLVVNGALLVLSNLDSAARFLRKDPSLTGRIPLWTELIQHVYQKPLLGSGYNAFWIGEGGAPTPLEFDVTGSWQVWQAHNGLLELALQLGALGVLIFLVGYAVAFGRAVRTLRSTALGNGFWAVAVLVFLLATSMGESMLLESSSLWWVVYLVIVFSPVVPPFSGQRERNEGTPARLFTDAAAAPTHASRTIQRARFRALPRIRWRTWR